MSPAVWLGYLDNVLNIHEKELNRKYNEKIEALEIELQSGKYENLKIEDLIE